MDKELFEQAERLEETLIGMRRDLHRIPEYDTDLPETAAYIEEKLAGMGIPCRRLHSVNGIVAEIRGDHDGETVLLRADMDGLRIEEAADRGFRSDHDGLMHACGHDAHMAILLTAAELLNREREKLHGTVRLVFQPGEETGHGAPAMIGEGILAGVSHAVALHVGSLAGSDYPPGSLILVPGAASSGFEKFRIRLRGVGTHSAYPEKGADPILAGCALVSAYQGIAFRELPAGTPFVLGIGSFHAGTDQNTIPSEAIITGSLRTQDESVRSYILNRMAAIGEDVCRAYRVEFGMETERLANPVINDETFAKQAFSAVREALGPDNVLNAGNHAFMAADDFAEYSMRVPSLYYFLHTNNAEKGITAPNHSPHFDVDESLLLRGVLSLLAITEMLLSRTE